MQPTCKKISPVTNSKVTLDDSSFDSCLDAYLGDEVGRIRKSVDNHCQNVLMDLLSFLESPKTSLKVEATSSIFTEKVLWKHVSHTIRTQKRDETLVCCLGTW